MSTPPPFAEWLDRVKLFKYDVIEMSDEIYKLFREEEYNRQRIAIRNYNNRKRKQESFIVHCSDGKILKMKEGYTNVGDKEKPVFNGIIYISYQQKKRIGKGEFTIEYKGKKYTPIETGEGCFPFSVRVSINRRKGE
jgi:hypothetical protein